MSRTAVVMFLLLVLAACAQSGDRIVPDEVYMEAHARYQSDTMAAKRVEYLKLTGLYRLDTTRENTFGSDVRNDISIDVNETPVKLGTIILAGDSVVFSAADSLHWTQADGRVVHQAVLTLDQAGRTAPLFYGRTGWLVMNREGNYFLRTWDKENPAAKDIPEYEWFPPDARYILEGNFTYYEQPKVTEVPSTFEFSEKSEFIGSLEFVFKGNTYSLDISPGGFLMFSDATSGKETYGSGRYMYIDLPKTGGPVRIDFNKAYNPPCIFSKFTTCQFPPKQNRLPFPVKAGEKNSLL